ncbi:MAG: S8 family serine peptidase, partial [Anaerolineae bacterium]
GITTGGEHVTIAVLSTGVMLDHLDLEDKIWTNPREIPENGIDDDGNGYVDDVHGWNFVNNDNDPSDDNCADPYYGLGTQLAGIAAAEATTNNGMGMAGVSWGARIMPVKVLDNHAAGYWPPISQGIRYAADNGAQIILMGFYGFDYSEELREAIDYAYSRGSFLVAPAGDCGQKWGRCPDDNPVTYPAAYGPHVVAVAATDEYDERAWFSEHGPYIDVAAPGWYIYGTACSPKDYYGLHGTSRAAAYVAGLAALVLSVNPDLTPLQIETIIRRSAVDLGPSGRDDYYGDGRIDAPAALLETHHDLRVTPTSLSFLCDDEGYIGSQCRRVTNPNTSHWTWTAPSSVPWLYVLGPIGESDSGYTPSWIEVCADVIGLPDTHGTYTTTLTLNSTMPLVDANINPRLVPVTFSYVSQAKRLYLPLITKDHGNP